MRPSGVPRRLLAAVALVSAVVVGAWLAAPDDSPSSGDPSSAPSVDAVVAPALAASASLPAATRAGGRVEGVVLRGRAPVVADVDAILRDGDARPSANVVRRTRVRSGPDGAFVLASLPVGEHRIVAQADDGTRAELAVSIPCDGAIVRRTLFLRPTHTLEGRAQYRDGRPFRGTIAVAPPSLKQEGDEDDREGLDWLRVTDDGAFVVAGRPPGSTVVWFREDGGRTRHFASPPLPRSPEAKAWTVVLDAFDVAIRGSVVDDVTGAPVAGATVTVTSREAIDRVSSDADGTFVARVSGSWAITFHAAARGYAPTGGTTFSSAPEVAPLTLRLQRGATLIGTVTRRQDGTPVAGALVHLKARGEDRELLPSLATTTDTAGHYRWEDLPIIDVSLEASAPNLTMRWHPPDRSRWSLTSVTLEAGRTVSVNVALEESIALVGRVVTHDGTPVAGAVVGNPNQGTLGMRLPPTVATDENGSFLFLGAPIGADVVLRATAPDGTHGESKVVRVEAEAQPIEIRLPQQRRVAIQVLDHKDRSALDNAELYQVHGSIVYTDGDGRAEIRIGTDDRRPGLTIRRHGYTDMCIDVDPTSPNTVTMWRIAPIAGEVVFSDGRAAQGAWVARSDALGAAVVTDAHGSFVLDGTDFMLGSSVEAVWYDADHVWVGSMPADSLTLVLGRHHVDHIAARRAKVQSHTDDEPITVRVLDPAGAPVPQFRLDGWLRPPAAGFFRSPISHWQSSNHLGTTTIVRKKGSNGWIEAHDPRNEWGHPLPLARTRVEIGAAQSDIEIRLALGLRLRGRVVDDTGFGVSGVRVDVLRWRDLGAGGSQNQFDLQTAPLASTRARSDGRFVIEGLTTEGGPHVVGYPSGEFLVPTPVLWTGGEEEVQIRVHRGVRPNLEIVDDEGAAIAGARVRVWLEWKGWARQVASQESDLRGQVVLDALDPKAIYHLVISPGDPFGLVELRNPAWTPRSGRMVLPRRVELTGRLLDEKGHPVEGYVSVRDPVSWSRTDETGHFRLTTQTGPVRLRAQVEGYIATEVAIDARANPSPIEIVLRRTHALRVRIVGPGPWPDEFYALRNGEAIGWGEVEDDGAVRFEGLDPTQPIEIWGPPPANGERFVLERLPGFGPEEHRVETRQGGVIRVRPRLPTGRTADEVVASLGAMSATGVALPNGDYEIRGLPVGRWTVEVRVALWPWEADGEWLGRAEASPGDSVDIEVRRAY